MIEPEILSPILRRWERATQLSTDDRQAVERLPCTRERLAKDGYLVREGEPAHNCALLLRGFAYRQKLTPRGTRQIISFHIPGEFVDLQNCLLEVADHSVQALNPAEVVLIPKPALTDLIDRHPAVGRAMWLDTLIDSSVFREWVVNVGRRDAKSRIAHLLCELWLRLSKSGAVEGESNYFPLTQEHLADATGLTAVHTNRTLQALRQDGLISLSAQSLTVLDWERLKAVGEFSERYLHHAA